MSKSLKRAVIVMGIAFAILVAGIVYSFKIASDSFEPAMHEDYVNRGLDYQKLLDSNEKARSEGWSLEVKTGTLHTAIENILPITVANEKGLPIESIEFEAYLERPATMKKRRKIIIDNVEGCVQSAACNLQGKVDKLAPGYYDLMIIAILNKSSRLVLQKRMIAQGENK